MYWASYPPRGNRGFGASVVRAGRFGRHADYLERETQEICILPQIESKIGYKNLDEIAAVKGIGGIFLEPIDLSVDMGHGLNIFHPEVANAMDDMIKRIHAKGIPVGTIALTPEQAKHFAELGVSFLALGGDTAFLAQAADNTFDTFKKIIES